MILSIVPLAMTLLAAQAIPETHATSLAGTAVNLPADLHDRPAVLVIGFQRASQDSVRGWGKRLAAGYRDSPSVAYYEVAVLASVPRMVRGFVIRSMKKDVSERAQARFLPVTENESLWRSLAHYDKPEDAYILIVAPDGTIQWQTAGPPTDAAYAELKKHLP